MMTVNLSTLARNRASNAVADLMDEGSSVESRIEFRTGTKPSTPQTAATGTLLATLTCANPAFRDAVNGSATSNTITSDIAVDATGTVGWFRIFNRNNQVVLDGDVSLTGGGGDIEFNKIDWVVGGIVALTSINFTEPQ